MLARVPPIVNLRSKHLIIASLLSLSGCADDGPPAGDVADTAPPTIQNVVAYDFTHLEIRFDEEVNRETAEYAKNYSVARRVIPNNGPPIDVRTAALRPDRRTVFLTTAAAMGDPDYDIRVTGVRDASGNAIQNAAVATFEAFHWFDQMPPEIMQIDPRPGASDVGIGQSVVVQFSEICTVEQFEWTSAGGTVTFEAHADGLYHTLYALEPLSLGAEYTISMVGVQDDSFNYTPDTLWTFTTTAIDDNTPLALVSSAPADGATNVASGTNLSLTFSESVDRPSFQIVVYPDLGEGVVTWSNDGRKVVIDPAAPLLASRQYRITIAPGMVTDLAGNSVSHIHSIHFTTGSALATGSIVGTVAGDATSDFAHDPNGATAFASIDAEVFYYVNAASSDDVGADLGYELNHLTDGWYYVFALINSNSDSWLSPIMGDAFGGYGMNIATGDDEAEYVTVSGGAGIAKIDFSLFDPSAVWGRIDYLGIHADTQGGMRVGLIDTTAFQPNAPPDHVTSVYWPYDIYWVINDLSGGSIDGTYFVRAFMDLNWNGAWDSEIEPTGLYGGESPIPIQIEGGSDANHVDIVLLDPLSSGPSSKAVTWPRPMLGEATRKRMNAVVREAYVARE